MIQRATIWRRGAVLLLVIWCAALPAIGWIRASRPTAAKTLSYVTSHPLESMPPDERLRIVDGLVARLNGLSFEQRQQAQSDIAMRRFYQQMTEAERARFWQQTLRTGMHQIVQAFNQMTPQARSRHLLKAVAELEGLRGETGGQYGFLPVETRERIIREGLQQFLMEADAGTKLELQPVLEKVQSILQMGR